MACTWQQHFLDNLVVLTLLEPTLSLEQVLLSLPRTTSCKREAPAIHWAAKYVRTRNLIDSRSWTINCSPLDISGSATCTTTAYATDEDNTSTDADPTYSTNIESSLFPVIFTAASGYSTASSTVTGSAAPSPTSPAPTPKSTSPTTTSTTTAHPSLGPSSKLGIGLGVPFGACALAGVALLLYRHGKHKERSRLSQMGNLAPPGGFTSGIEGKKMSEAGVDSQTLGRQPPVYSMEMQG